MRIRLREVWQLCLVFLVLDVCLGPWLPEPFYDSPAQILDAAATRIAFCVVLSALAWLDKGGTSGVKRSSQYM